MHTSITRVAVAVAAAAMLSGLGVSGAGASGAATQAPALAASHTAAVPGAQLWVKRYNGPSNLGDGAFSVAVSPTGDRVFVTGSSDGRTKYHWATVAYDSTTGAWLWIKRYDGRWPKSVAVSPDGNKVFVTGDGATVAYNAATGTQLWAQPYSDNAFSVAAL